MSDSTRNSKHEHYGMEYMERIDAHIDSGIFELIEFFLDRGYRTEYCCSGLFKDHYTQEELNSFPKVREDDAYEYTFDVMRPYISFSSIFHTLEDGTATVDDTVYYLKEALSNRIGLVFCSGTPSEYEVDNIEKISLNFDLGTPYQGNPKAYHTYIMRMDKYHLKKCFNYIDKDISLYDDILKTALKIVMLAVGEPILGHHMSIKVYKDSQSISTKATVRYLPDEFDETDLYVEDGTDVDNDEGIGQTQPRYEVYGDLEDVIRELYERPDQDYIDSLYEEGDLDMEPFEHPISQDSLHKFM